MHSLASTTTVSPLLDAGFKRLAKQLRINSNTIQPWGLTCPSGTFSTAKTTVESWGERSELGIIRAANKKGKSSGTGKQTVLRDAHFERLIGPSWDTGGGINGQEGYSKAALERLRHIPMKSAS